MTVIFNLCVWSMNKKWGYISAKIVALSNAIKIIFALKWQHPAHSKYCNVWYSTIYCDSFVLFYSLIFSLVFCKVSRSCEDSCRYFSVFCSEGFLHTYNPKYIFIGIDFNGTVWNIKFLLMPSWSPGTWRQRHLFLPDTFWIIFSLNTVLTKGKYYTTF